METDNLEKDACEFIEKARNAGKKAIAITFELTDKDKDEWAVDILIQDKSIGEKFLVTTLLDVIWKCMPYLDQGTKKVPFSQFAKHEEKN